MVLSSSPRSSPKVWPVTSASSRRMVTAAATGFTVISLASLMPLPSAAVAVMVTVRVPSTFLAVTLPLVLTVAIFGSVLNQVTFLLVASAGPTSATNWMLFPAATSAGPLISMFLTKVATLIFTVAFLPLPSVAVAVMVAVPLARPVTRPSAETVATLALLVVHLTFWSEVWGCTFAIKASVLLPSGPKSMPRVWPVTSSSSCKIVTAATPGGSTVARIMKSPSSGSHCEKRPS